MSHVAYPAGDWGSSQEDAYAADCPSSHPKRIPEIQMYFRILDYPGGAFTFSDMTSEVHSDYFSGWEESELQRVLDTCNNDGEAALSNRWCQQGGVGTDAENYFSFRDMPKLDPETQGGNDHRIRNMLQALQPNPPLDLQSTVSAEKIDGVATIPSGACTGTLLPADSSLDWMCTPNCTTPIGTGAGDRSLMCDGTTRLAGFDPARVGGSNDGDSPGGSNNQDSGKGGDDTSGDGCRTAMAAAVAVAATAGSAAWTLL